jgi:hypothetical protein
MKKAISLTLILLAMVGCEKSIPLEEALKGPDGLPGKAYSVGIKR